MNLIGTIGKGKPFEGKRRGKVGKFGYLIGGLTERILGRKMHPDTGTFKRSTCGHKVSPSTHHKGLLNSRPGISIHASFAIALFAVAFLALSFVAPNSAYAAKTTDVQSWTDNTAANCATPPPADGSTETIFATVVTGNKNQGGATATSVPMTVDDSGGSGLVTGDITQICLYLDGALESCQTTPTLGSPYNLLTSAMTAGTLTYRVVFAASGGGKTAQVTSGIILPDSGVACPNTGTAGYNNSGGTGCAALPQTTAGCTAQL
jgi:hypothetical protein